MEWSEGKTSRRERERETESGSDWKNGQLGRVNLVGHKHTHTHTHSESRREGVKKSRYIIHSVCIWWESDLECICSATIVMGLPFKTNQINCIFMHKKHIHNNDSNRIESSVVLLFFPQFSKSIVNWKKKCSDLYFHYFVSWDMVNTQSAAAAVVVVAGRCFQPLTTIGNLIPDRHNEIMKLMCSANANIVQCLCVCRSQHFRCTKKKISTMPHGCNAEREYAAHSVFCLFIFPRDLCVACVELGLCFTRCFGCHLCRQLNF